MAGESRPEIVVIGATGMLGTAVAYHFRGRGYEVREVPRAQFEIGRDPVSRLALEGAACVVNAAGMINRRLGEGNRDADAYLVNSLFPRLLADRCEVLGVPLVHVSTDCVFDGSRGPYDESSPTDATDLYGRSKAMGEPSNCLVLRTSIIGPERRNFYLLLTWFLAQSGEVRGYTNHRWNGVTSLELARCIERVLEGGLYTHGVRHVHGEDITKCDLLCAIGKVFKHAVPVSAFEDPVPRDTRLRTRYPAFLDPLGVASVEDQLRALLPLHESLKAAK